jgi:hypothetical protein
MTFVVDTNVVIVANGRESPQASIQCVAACIQSHREIMTAGRIALDRGDLIFEEYLPYARWHGQIRVGDAFFKWVFDHYWNPERCDLVPITPRDNSFEEFPAEERLAGFDPADRKFVAVAVSHPDHPPILQAVDTKWREFVEPLDERGVNVQFLCG